MTIFRDHLFKMCEQAVDAVIRARSDLRDAMDKHEDTALAAAMDQAAHTVPYARWWIDLTRTIEHGGLDPMIALTNARTAARQSLLQSGQPIPNRSWFTIAQSHATAEATRRFYHDTAIFNVEAITGPGPSAPSITGPAYPTPPRTTATPPHQATHPAWRPAINPGPVLRPHPGPDTPLDPNRW
ncbi:hypothetical protein GCM10027176_51850 [Actinoallomurus bryophytorum]|uniref:Uncharacterized protein n=1 Tax=Actinoallomurus bryophytorum TaxID=1490222 RepID=A0A543CI44_9ACTN|nr:hypothetical protein [Actinoallomurus bryophytorum]TQL96577.1 hypothetical protein FB559_2116 [Actinoallomurus bryophytorum]